jgi:SAM-dependent methyltransferase
MSSPSVSPDDWDQHWEHYAEANAQNPAQRMRYRIIARLLCETKGAKRNILELGSGQGDLLRKLDALLPDARFLGIEMSEKGAAISRQKVSRATIIAADIMRPPADLHPYVGWANQAVCSEVLEHVDDPVSFLRQARRYLANRGRLIITVPGGPMSAFDRHIGHRQHFTRKKLARILAEAGYSVERVFASGFPFFNLFRLLIIARGEGLARDLEAQSMSLVSKVGMFLMKGFDLLFYCNLPNSPYGWQLVAVARKGLV